MNLEYLYSSVFIGIIAGLLLITTALSRRWKMLIKEVIILTPVLILLSFYFFNSSFNFIVKSVVFPTESHSIMVSKEEKIDFRMPKGSVWLYKTPSEVYRSKSISIEKCKEHFSKELDDLAKNNIISRFSYNQDEKAYNFYVEKGDKTIAEIFISKIESDGSLRFGIRDLLSHPYK